MYRNRLHKEQIHVSALDNGHLQVENEKNLVSSYTRLMWIVYSPRKSSIAAYYFFHSQPEDGHCQLPKHAFFLYEVNFYTYLYHQIKLC